MEDPRPMLESELVPIPADEIYQMAPDQKESKLATNVVMNFIKSLSNQQKWKIKIEERKSSNDSIHSMKMWSGSLHNVINRM